MYNDLADLSTRISSTGCSLGSSHPNQAGSGAISYAKKALGVTSVASTNNAGEEQLTDKNGAVWIYGKADAPDCINGKMVFASGTSKAGKPYKGWFDPMKGPKPMRKPEGYTPVDPIFLK
jgi:subtilisin family serine protease